MPPDHHVHAGRVTTAHLHAIECSEGLLDGEIRVARRVGGTLAGEFEHRNGVAHAVVANRPVRVLQTGELEAATFDLRYRQSACCLEGGLGRERDRVEGVQAGREVERELTVVHERGQSRVSTQQLVDTGNRRGSRADIT